MPSRAGRTGIFWKVGVVSKCDFVNVESEFLAAHSEGLIL